MIHLIETTKAFVMGTLQMIEGLFSAPTVLDLSSFFTLGATTPSHKLLNTPFRGAAAMDD